jgi:hypothetical protein
MHDNQLATAAVQPKIQQLFLAVAERDDGEVIYGAAYDNYAAANSAAGLMCQDLNLHTAWIVSPTVINIDYVPG